MKKKVIGLVFLAAIATAAFWSTQQQHQQSTLNDLILSNSEALAKSSGCENGCIVKDFSGCKCNGDYPQYTEYSWSK